MSTPDNSRESTEVSDMQEAVNNVTATMQASVPPAVCCA